MSMDLDDRLLSPPDIEESEYVDEDLAKQLWGEPSPEPPRIAPSAQDTGTPAQKSSTRRERRIAPRLIVDPGDSITKMQRLVFQVIEQLSTDGRLEVSLTMLTTSLAEKLPDNPMRKPQWMLWLRKTVRICLVLLKQRGFIARLYPPNYVDCEVFLVRTVRERWTWIKANGYTHFRNKGRGVELLRLAGTNDTRDTQ